MLSPPPLAPRVAEDRNAAHNSAPAPASATPPGRATGVPAFATGAVANWATWRGFAKSFGWKEKPSLMMEPPRNRKTERLRASVAIVRIVTFGFAKSQGPSAFDIDLNWEATASSENPSSGSALIYALEHELSLLDDVSRPGLAERTTLQPELGRLPFHSRRPNETGTLRSIPAARGDEACRAVALLANGAAGTGDMDLARG